MYVGAFPIFTSCPLRRNGKGGGDVHATQFYSTPTAKEPLLGAAATGTAATAGAMSVAAATGAGTVVTFLSTADSGLASAAV